MNAHTFLRTVDQAQGPGPCPVITTGRFVLRPHRINDAAAIAASLSDYKVSRMLSPVPAPYHLEDALDWLEQPSRGWTLAIADADDRHIGCVGIELREGRWGLGYWLNRDHWGKGLMTAAAGAAIDRFSTRMPDQVLHSGVFADNLASLHVQAKLGFRITGCRQVYALARNEMVPLIETVLEPGELRRP